MPNPPQDRKYRFRAAPSHRPRCLPAWQCCRSASPPCHPCRPRTAHEGSGVSCGISSLRCVNALVGMHQDAASTSASAGQMDDTKRPLAFVKFHLMSAVRKPPCSFFRCCHTSLAALPLTSTLSNSWKFAPAWNRYVSFTALLRACHCLLTQSCDMHADRIWPEDIPLDFANALI